MHSAFWLRETDKNPKQIKVKPAFSRKPSVHAALEIWTAGLQKGALLEGGVNQSLGVTGVQRHAALGVHSGVTG